MTKMDNVKAFGNKINVKDQSQHKNGQGKKLLLELLILQCPDILTITNCLQEIFDKNDDLISQKESELLLRHALFYGIFQF